MARRALRHAFSCPNTRVHTIALLVIAVGIGANTAVFSVVDAVLLKPLTYSEPQSLVQLVTTSNRGPIPVASIPEYSMWQQQSAVFQQVAAYDWGGAGMNLTGGEHPEQVRGMHVTSGYFALFGAPLVAGRTFTTAEDRPNGGHFAVLSFGLWQRRFGGNRKVVGSTIQMDGQPWLVVGVIGPDFVTDTPVDLWIPFQFDLTSREMARNFDVAARLKPGVTTEQSNAQLALAAAQFRRTYGSNALPPHSGFGAVPLQESLVGDTRLPLMILLGAVGFVLLIACANVANLLLAQASVRKREFATRAALGAGRGQIIRQLLTRQRFNMLFLTIFGAAGLLMAAIGVYRVMSYTVQQRTRELGVRMALGAEPSKLRNMVIGHGMGLAAAGLILGLGGAFWLTRFLASFLFGVTARDPIAFLATRLLLGAVALFAVCIPAHRATRVDPMTALRLE